MSAKLIELKILNMKKIVKLYILITAFSLTLSSNSIAQNEKKQVIKDVKKASTQDVKIANNDDEENAKIDGKFYIGVDALLQNTILGSGAKNPYDYYEPQTSAIAVFTGYDDQDFFKIESFYSKSNEKNQISSTNNFSSYELKTRTLGVDFKPYLNFDKESRGLLYLIFGLNYNQINTVEVNQTKTYGVFGELTSNKIIARNSSIKAFAPSFGFGVEYLCYKNFALRFQYKRNFVDAKIANSEVLSKIKVIENFSVGISHSF